MRQQQYQWWQQTGGAVGQRDGGAWARREGFREERWHQLSREGTLQRNRKGSTFRAEETCCAESEQHALAWCVFSELSALFAAS